MKKWIPILALIICCMIWGSTFVVIKNVSSAINPYLLSTFRNGLAVLIMFPIIFFSSKRACLKNKESLKYGFITGTFLAGIYVVQTTGLQFTSSNHSAFITSSAVIIVPIILVLLRRHKLTFQQVFSILIIMVGIFFLTNTGSKSSYNIGDIITFIGAFICAGHIILSGIYVRKTELLSLVFYQFLFATFLSFIGLLFHTKGVKIQFEEGYLFEILYLGIIGTLFCFFVTVWAQKYISTVYAMMIFSLEPVFAAISSYVYSGETFTEIEVFGAIGIFAGLIIYSIPLKIASK
jgi:drug/metabolite transporter (DMT)-like permease